MSKLLSSNHSFAENCHKLSKYLVVRSKLDLLDDFEAKLKGTVFTDFLVAQSPKSFASPSR